MSTPSQARAILELQARIASVEERQQAAMNLAAERAARQDAMAALVQEVRDALLGVPPEGGLSFLALTTEVLQERDALRRASRFIINASKLVTAIGVLVAAWLAANSFGGKP